MMNSTTTSKNKNKINRLHTGLGAAAFWLVVWQVISMLVAQELLVPAPLVVLKALSGLVRTSEFWQSAGRSLLRILLGILLSPLLRLVRATPVASFIILALVWIKTGYLPSFISFLMVVPLVWNNVESGIKHIDIRLLEMAKVFRLSWFKTLIFVRIPSVMPYFMAACTAGMGLAWKSGIAAEVICRPPFSIGNQLQNAKSHLETPQVFAWTITVILLSLVLEKLLVSFAAGFGKRFNAGGGN